MASETEQVRRDIKAKFGSVRKMATASGIAPTTIYHALDRGIENTTTKTRRAILEAVYGEAVYSVVTVPTEEDELLSIYRSLDERGRSMLMAAARALR